jgi:hypothetical protein
LALSKLKLAGADTCGATPNYPAYLKTSIPQPWSDKQIENGILRLMRRSHVWLLIAALWFAITLFSALRRTWSQVWLQGVVALIFLGVGLYTRRREQIR